MVNAIHSVHYVINYIYGRRCDHPVSATCCNFIQFVFRVWR